MSAAPTLTLAQLEKLEPCSDRMDKMREILPKRRRITAQQARDAGASFGDIVWAASAVASADKDVERRLRMWMADCAARVLPIYEKSETGAAPREAIIAARRYANGEIDDAAWAAARDAAGDAAWAAARAAAWAAARAAARDAAWAAARAAARDAAGDAAGDAARAAARAAEEEVQFNLLCQWLSDGEPEPIALEAKQVAA